MKNYLKGLLSGLLIAAVLCCVPAFAENIQALFNQIRINVNGIDIAQWGESYTLESGEEVPYSISYRDTTYLPLRKIGEINDKKVYWNGDSNTASMTGYQSEINELAEKPDNNGNIWTYYTFKADGDTYLGVKDKTRGYERVYRLPGGYIDVDDEGITFITYGAETDINRYNHHTVCRKIEFLNTPDTQDGTELFGFNGNIVAVDNDYIYYKFYTAPSTMARDKIIVFDPKTGETIASRLLQVWKQTTDWELIDEGVFRYCIPENRQTYQITFDKTSNTFSEPIKVE